MNNHLNFDFHINEKIKKAKAAKAQIKKLSKIYGFFPRLVQKIQVVAVQSVVLYKVKL